MALAGRLLVMHPVLSSVPIRLSASTISGRRSPDQQRQDVLASNLRAERERFGREQLIEGFKIHFRALEFRPGIFQMIARVGAPDNIGG